MVRRGNQLFDAELYRLAVAAYEHALEMDRNDPDVITDLGVCYRELRKPAEAARLFREAAQLDAQHAASRLNLGIVLYYDLGETHQAVQALEDCLRVAPPGSSAATEGAKVLGEIHKRSLVREGKPAER